MPLSEDKRQQLDGIVQKMTENKESDENIQAVVNDFKTKYETKAPEKTFLQKAAPYVRPTLETGGMLAGGALATPETFGLGTVAGSGLGYAGGRQLANLYEQLVGLRKPEGTLESLTGTAKDVATGGAMEAGGQVGSKILQKGVSTLEPILKKEAEKLYGSAIKTPLSKRWVKELPGEEISRRTRAIREGIASEIPRSDIGLQKLKNLEKETRSLVDSIVNEGAAKGDKVNFDEWIQSGIQRAEKIAAKSSDPKGARATIQDIVKKFEAHLPEEESVRYKLGEVKPPREIDTKKLNEIKRQLYDETSWNFAEKTGLSAQITEATKKGLAHDAMQKLEKQYPALDQLNAKDSALIDLREAIERELARYDNRDIVGLGTKVLIRKATWPLAIWNATLGNPAIKTKLAFALSKADRFAGLPTTTKAISYGVLKPEEKEKKPNNLNDMINKTSSRIGMTP